MGFWWVITQHKGMFLSGYNPAKLGMFGGLWTGMQHPIGSYEGAV